jgi:hypothetical protein
VAKRTRNRLSEELRTLRIGPGGRGCFIVLAPNVRGGFIEWVSPAAWAALERAAERIGFEGEGLGVVDAIVAGCWVDLLSEAIEEAEA